MQCIGYDDVVDGAFGRSLAEVDCDRKERPVEQAFEELTYWNWNYRE